MDAVCCGVAAAAADDVDAACWGVAAVDGVDATCWGVAAADDVDAVCWGVSAAVDGVEEPVDGAFEPTKSAKTTRKTWVESMNFAHRRQKEVTTVVSGRYSINRVVWEAAAAAVDSVKEFVDGAFESSKSVKAMRKTWKSMDEVHAPAH